MKVWVCLECAKCVTCGLQGGEDVILRSTTLYFRKLIPTIVFFCREHEQLSHSTSGLALSRIPKSLLEQYVRYLTFQRERLVREDSPVSRERVQLVNGLMSEMEATISTMGMSHSQDSSPAGLVIKETVREIVKIPCSYCGTFSPVTEAKCMNCGAPLMRR